MPPARTETKTGPTVGFAWIPRADNAFVGDGQTVVRGGFGVGYDVIFYNQLTSYASNYPRVVVADLFDVANVYPSLIPATGSAVFNPLATYSNAPEDAENPESRFYSLTVQRELGVHLFEVGYSGSRAYKGINQLHANPAILTPEQAALVAAAGMPTRFQASRRGACSQRSETGRGFLHTRVRRQRCRGAFRVHAVFFRQAAFADGCSSRGRTRSAAGTGTTTTRPWAKGDGRVEPAPAEHVRL